MSALIRKLLVFATIDGLILQAHAPADNQKAVLLDFERNDVKKCPKHDIDPSKTEYQLEAHGIVGIKRLADVWCNADSH